jgi:predicted TIM-barrel fold metal-dependent hydrolase
MHPTYSASLAQASRRRFIGNAACCGLGAALGLFHVPQALAGPTPPAHWPAPVAALWQRAWQGVAPEQVADVHVHLLGHTAAPPFDDGGAWIHPRSLSPLAFGDWVRRIAIEHASGVTGDRERLSAAYLDRLQSLWADFPTGARPLLLAFDAAVDAQGRPDPDRTMFCTGNGYARDAAAGRGWGWIASVHPDRADAVERLQSAHAGGARAVKWLPSAMGIDPSARRYRRFYREMARLDLPLLSHAGEEKAVTGANAHECVNPLLLRHPLDEGVRVVVAHCATLGQARDLDHPLRPAVPAFELFARLMDDPELGARVQGDFSAVTQVNRSVADLRTLLSRTDWHGRLLYGSDYPLPALPWLTSVARLAGAGLLDAQDVAPLKALQALNPLAFDFALKRSLHWQGVRWPAGAFETLRRL